MKKILSVSLNALFLAVIFSFNSCTKDENADETLTVSYTVPNHEACLSFYPVQYTDVSTNDITTADVQQAFATTGVAYDASKIITAKLVSLKATATGSNFDEISTIEVLVRLAGASSDVQIAHAESIATGATSVTLTVNTVELKSFITALSELTVKIKNKGSNNSVCVDFSQGVVQVEVQK